MVTVGCVFCMSFKELKSIFDKVTPWPQLILKFLVAPAVGNATYF